jgi:small subunit ribosomal protein S21
VATVTLRPGESQEELLKRFRKQVAEAGILSTCREKRWFVSKGELRRKQAKRALRKMRTKQRQLERRM